MEIKHKQTNSLLDSFLKLKENKTNVRTEILAGVIIFIANTYYSFVSPTVLRTAGLIPLV